MAYWIAIFGGAGLSKFAPGTVGSFASLIIWAPLLLLEVSWPLRLFITLVIFLLGWWAVNRSLSRFCEDDPQIVIDEVAGMGLALGFCSASPLNILAGFALFRFFDVLKPWPIGVADRRIKGPFGVMFDDLLAGAFAALALFAFDIWMLPLIAS